MDDARTVWIVDIGGCEEKTCFILFLSGYFMQQKHKNKSKDTSELYLFAI